MLGYKGFRKDLTCTMGRGTFQYEPGRWYDESLAHSDTTDSMRQIIRWTYCHITTERPTGISSCSLKEI